MTTFDADFQPEDEALLCEGASTSEGDRGRNPETSSIEKAYNRGRKMGAYIIDRDGIEKAFERGSLGNIVYRVPSMAKAYDEGYKAAIAESK